MAAAEAEVGHLLRSNFGNKVDFLHCHSKTAAENKCFSARIIVV